MKKILSILLVVLMLVGMLPMNAMHAHAAEESATLTWSTSIRTVFSTSQQVFTQNGITVTNNKGSGSNIADYAPPRFYANSQLIIECALGNITKIEILASGSSYATAMVNSAKSVSGTTASASGNTVTIVPPAGSDTFTIAKMTAQVRTGATLKVYYEAASTCQHANTTTTTVEATCTTEGQTTVTCNDCGDEISKTSIPMIAHNYVDNVCTGCGKTLGVVSFVVPNQVAPVDSETANEKTGQITLPAAQDYTGENAKHAYTFAGWATDPVSEETNEKPALLAAGSLYTPEAATETLYAVYTYAAAGGTAEEGYVETALADIAPSDVVVITAVKSGKYYAMSNSNGTGSAPAAVVVTVENGKLTDEPADNIKWNIATVSGGYTIYPNGTTSTWLYTTSTNNGVRVGTNSNKVFAWDSSNYFKNTATSRYIGVYSTQDWRCYTTNTGTSNIAGQTFAFFVKQTGVALTYTSVLEDVNTECSHSETTTVTVDKTCTEDGYIAVICDLCDAEIEREILTATGHNEVIDAAQAATCVDTGLTEGKHCSICNVVTVAQKEIPATGEHSYEDDVCTVCGQADPAASPVKWSLVKDGDSLQAGDLIVIVNQADTHAMSTTQNTNNRPAVAVDIDGELLNLIDTVLILELGEGTVENTWSLYATNGTNKGYLYAASSSGNNLKTQASVNDNASWIITIDADGNATVIAQGSNSRNEMRFNANNGNPLFSVYGNTSELPAVKIYKQTCKHENTVEHAAVPATCTAVGYTAGVYCEDCESYIEGHEQIDMIGHDWQEQIIQNADCLNDGEAQYTCAVCQESKTEVLPATGHTEVTDAGKAPTCVSAGISEGKHCSVCNEVLQEQEELPATGVHTYENDICTVCGQADPSAAPVKWVLVTDVNTLAEGDRIVIVNQPKDDMADYALGVTQNGNNRAAVAVTVEGNLVVINDQVQILVLEAGLVEGSWGMYAHNGTFNGYLYAASNSSSNHLKTTDKLDENGSWAFTIDAQGNATVIAQGTNQKNNLRFNPNNDNPIFSAYGSTSDMAGVKIYKQLCRHDNQENHDAVAPTCTAVGYTAGVYCADCDRYLEGHEQIAMIDHEWNDGEVTVTPDCVNDGEMTYTCVSCPETKVEVLEATGHSYDAGVVTNPTPTQDGFTTYTCGNCDHSYTDSVVPAFGDLKFSTASLVLQQNLSINFIAKAELFADYAYNAPYAVFTFGSETLTVTEYTVADGKYYFTCTNITPSQMTELVSATLYANYNGEAVEGITMTYSVAQYCESLLAQTDDVVLHTLIVDMLYYGDEASKYTGYRDEELPTTILTEEQKQLHTTAIDPLTTVLNGSHSVAETVKASWKAVTLVLDDSVQIRYRLAAENIEGLSVVASAAGQTWTIDTFEPVAGMDGQYYVYFDMLAACMMRQTVLVTVYEGDTAVSNTLSYSVESYAYARQNDAKLAALVNAMITYGDSAYNYFMKEEV